MSRVFSRASLSVRARVSDSSAVAGRVLGMREMSQPRLSPRVSRRAPPRTRKKALDPWLDPRAPARTNGLWRIRRRMRCCGCR